MSSKREQLATFIEQQDWERAAPLAERLARQHPRDAQLLQYHLLCLFQEERLVEAVDVYHERLPRLEGDTTELLPILGEARNSLGLPALSHHTLRTYIEAQPQPWSDLIRELSRKLDEVSRACEWDDDCYEQIVQEDRAQELLFRQKFVELLEQVPDWLRRFPDSTGLRAVAAEACLETDRVEEGIALCEASPRLSAELTYRHLCLLVSDGRLRQAREIAKRLSGMCPGDEIELGFILRSFCLLNWNRRVLQTVREHAHLPHNQDALFAISSALFALGKTDAARRFFARIDLDDVDEHEAAFLGEALESGDPDQGLLRGDLLLDLMPRQALEDMEPWLRRQAAQDGLQPDSRTTKEARRWVERYPRVKRLVPWMLRFADLPHKLCAFYILLASPDDARLQREAWKFVKDARIPLLRTRKVVLMILADRKGPGVYTFRVGRKKHGLAVCGVSWSPDLPFRGKPRARELLRRAGPLLNQQRFEEAEGTLIQALEHSPDEPQLHYHLAVCRELMGQKEKAERSLQRCLELQPDHPGARLTRARWLALQGEVAQADELWRETMRSPRLWAGYEGEFYAAKLAILSRQSARRAQIWRHAWQAVMPNHPLMRLGGDTIT